MGFVSIKWVVICKVHGIVPGIDIKYSIFLIILIVIIIIGIVVLGVVIFRHHYFASIKSFR